MLGNEKRIYQYINHHMKIFELKNITTMELLEIAYKKYKSSCLYDIEKNEVIEEIVEKIEFNKK